MHHPLACSHFFVIKIDKNTWAKAAKNFSVFPTRSEVLTTGNLQHQQHYQHHIRDFLTKHNQHHNVMLHCQLPELSVFSLSDCCLGKMRKEMTINTDRPSEWTLLLAIKVKVLMVFAAKYT